MRFVRGSRNGSIMPMAVIIVLIAVWMLISQNAQQPANVDTHDEQQPASVSTSDEYGELIVHVLDVGQADSILVQWPGGHNMLIDGGNKDDGRAIVKYLEQAGVKQLDYLIATHPHEDHIGGLPYIIGKISIKRVYMPKVTANTKIYEDLLKAIKDKGLTINTARAGVALPLDGVGISAEFLGPIGDKYDDLNQYSAVLKLQYGQNSFLFMGDAGLVAEQQMLDAGEDLKADVIKIGHHGSSDATSDALLDAVQPRAAVISVGRNNDYGHPDKTTLDKLQQRGITIYRTDEDGIVTFISDGKDIKVGTSRGSK